MKEESIDVIKYVNLLFKNWKTIILFSLFAGIISIIISIFILKDIYRSSAVLMPASASNSGLASSSTALGGFAAMTGVDLGGGSSMDKTKLANEMLLSRDFYRKLYDSDESLLINLIAAKGYDKRTGKIIINQNIYDEKNKFWLYYDKDSNKKPSIQDTHGDFLNLISFDQDLKSKFVYISVKHLSPIVAHSLLETIIYELSEQIRVFDNAEAEKSMSFIVEQSSNATSASFRKTINELYNSQLHKLMLTEVSDGYAFRTIESPVVAEKKYLPMRAVIVILSTMLGGLLSIFYVLIYRNPS